MPQSSVPTEREISKMTYAIEHLLPMRSQESVHPELADLYFERAELYFRSSQFDWAIEDYNTCLEYNPYFYEADMGRELVYLTIKEKEEQTALAA